MTESIQEIRVDLAARSKWNIGYFYAGLAFWLYAGVIGWVHPVHVARIYWLVGTFFIFPVAVLVSKLLHADPFSKGNPLGEVVGHTHMSVILMTLPLVLVACFRYPELMILVMAISYSLDFYLMSWAFGSPMFIVHAVIRTAAVSAIWLVAPDLRAWLIPAVVAAAYAITVTLSPALRRQWLATRQARPAPVNAT
jgi:hypothetical protein